VLLVMIKKEMFYNDNKINLFTAVIICAAAFRLSHCVPISPSLTFRLHCRKSQCTVEQSITKHFVPQKLIKLPPSLVNVSACCQRKQHE
jgi:hypothetical protein